MGGGRGGRGERGNGGTVAFEKAPQNFYEKGGWISFVQVRLRTNIAPSLASGDRSGAAHAVIRRLFGVGAGIRVEDEGDGGTCDSILLGGRPWENISHHNIARFPSPNEVSYHYPINYIPQSLPVEGILPSTIHEWTQSLPVEGGSHREPLANDLLMYWTAPNWCANGLAQTISINPFHKSFAELFQKRPFPRSPVPPFPRSPVPPFPRSPRSPVPPFPRSPVPLVPLFQ